MGVLPQALKSSLKCKGKGGMKKIARRKSKLSNSQKVIFFFFSFSLDPS
jgi:hypothetical protein